MAEAYPKTDVEKIAQRIQIYLEKTGLTLDSLLDDNATIVLPNGEPDTVQSDLVNVMSVPGERIGVREQLEVAFALGVVVGKAFEYLQRGANSKYEKIAYDLAMRTAVERGESHDS